DGAALTHASRTLRAQRPSVMPAVHSRRAAISIYFRFVLVMFIEVTIGFRGRFQPRALGIFHGSPHSLLPPHPHPRTRSRYSPGHRRRPGPTPERTRQVRLLRARTLMVSVLL